MANVFTLIRKRENPKDIWYHLYEFPCEESDSEAIQQRSNLTSNSEAVSLTHILSHQKIHARYIIHKVQKMPDLPGTLLIPWEDLNEYALSRLTLRALDKLRAALPR